jgi:hypothetical protein
VKKIDLTEKRFGRLIAVEEAPKNKHGNTMWECLCDCGNKISVPASHLRSGNTKSCGCYEHDLLVERNTKHGLGHHQIYSVWKDMLRRCYNPANKHYKYYGGRGIAVCDEWKDNPKAFIAWAENHGWKKKLDIDRFNNDKGYSPNNCRFATRSGNLLNTRLLHAGNSTGFRGVSWHKKTKKYRADIQVEGKRHWLGTFPSAVEAAKARDAFVIKNGLHTPLNFPEVMADHVLEFGNGGIRIE